MRRHDLECECISARVSSSINSPCAYAYSVYKSRVYSIVQVAHTYQTRLCCKCAALDPHSCTQFSYGIRRAGLLLPCSQMRRKDCSGPARPRSAPSRARSLRRQHQQLRTAVSGLIIQDCRCCSAPPWALTDSDSNLLLQFYEWDARRQRRRSCGAGTAPGWRTRA